MGVLIHDSGTNFNLYYNVLDYWKTIMSNHPSLGVVTQGDIFEIDQREFPAYPLGNVLITGVAIGDKTSNYTIQLTVADKVKLKNDESSGSFNYQVIPYEGSDDVVDIHANTYAIINDLTSYTQRALTGIQVLGDINCVPFKDNFDNGLAGWVATFDMTVHNDRNICIFDLITTTTTTSGPTTTTTTGAPTTTTTSTTTSTTSTTSTTTTLAPTTTTTSTTTAAPTTTTTTAGTTTTTTSGPTTTTTTSAITTTYNLWLGGFSSDTLMNYRTNNPNGWFLRNYSNTIYPSTPCTTASGTRGLTTTAQLNPGPNNLLENFNTAGYNSSQYYTFGGGELSRDGVNWVIIGASGIYDMGGGIGVNLRTGNCTSVNSEPS